MHLTLRYFTGKSLGSSLASFGAKWKNAATRTQVGHVDERLTP